jgi:hypothetical protein
MDVYYPSRFFRLFDWILFTRKKLRKTRRFESWISHCYFSSYFEIAILLTLVFFVLYFCVYYLYSVFTICILHTLAIAFAEAVAPSQRRWNIRRRNGGWKWPFSLLFMTEFYFMFECFTETGAHIYTMSTNYTYTVKFIAIATKHFMWGSYPASLRNVGGSTRVPVRAWKMHRGALEVFLHE